MRRENYLLILGWMYELELTKNEREIFALIYGFSQSGQGEFVGSLSYISEALEICRASVVNGLNSLIEKKLITKTVHGKRNSNSYQTCQEEVDKLLESGNEDATSLKNRLVQNLDQSNDATSLKNRPVTSLKNRPNININNINKNNISKDILQKEKPKHKYGSYKNVILTDEQYEKLQSEYPDYESRIENMSGYCEASGKTYKNYYAALKNWDRKDKEQKQTNNKFVPKIQNDYDFDDYEKNILSN